MPYYHFVDRGKCHAQTSCIRPVKRFFLWPLFADGTGETVGGEYCRKHGKEFNWNCQKDDQVLEVTKFEFIMWQVHEA